MSYFQIHKNFFSEAKQLRAEFDKNFDNPRSTDSKRFVWDNWFIKNQYNVIRTPAFHYFSPKLYQNFHSHLVQWGRENLGCHDISPTWLSYYVDGCFQGIHSDVPHGPWAFVYSLTLNPKAFEGGETFILKPETLNFWPNFQEQTYHEGQQFIEKIPSPFNQLTIFDPRRPHGVTEVKGTRDPQQGRLVVHGWFVEPRPYVIGGLKANQVQKVVAPVMEELADALSMLGQMHGTVSLRCQISKQGKVVSYQEITNTLESLNQEMKDVKKVRQKMKSLFSQVEFPLAVRASQLTIPILFK